MNNLSKSLSKSLIMSPKLRKIALKKIHSSPQLKNALRHKWQQRLKEKRNAAFNNQRFLPGQEEELLDESFSTETFEMMNDFISSFAVHNEIDSDTDLEDWIEKKCAEEEAFNQEQLMMEYENFSAFEEYITSLMNENNLNSSFVEVICPICQKHLMTQEGEVIGCTNCKFVLPPKISLKDFSNSITAKSTMHSENCSSCPTFITTPENDTISLYLICDVCSCCLLII